MASRGSSDDYIRVYVDRRGRHTRAECGHCDASLKKDLSLGACPSCGTFLMTRKYRAEATHAR